jgi:hypothetical protein
VKSFINWIYMFAAAIGGPGLFASRVPRLSFISLPQINDILVVLMVTANKAWMPYYALMATLGSIAGCYVIYYLAEKGGEAFIRKRLRHGSAERAPGTLQTAWPDGVDDSSRPSARPRRSKLFVLLAGRGRRSAPEVRDGNRRRARDPLSDPRHACRLVRRPRARVHAERHGRVVALALAGIVAAASAGGRQSRRRATP